MNVITIEEKQKPFIHLFRNSLGGFIYDVNKNDILKIPNKVYSYLDANMSNETLHLDEETKRYTDLLKCNGYLKSNRVEISEHPVTEIYDSYVKNKLSQITLQVTQKCNLACEYCSYSGSYHNRSHADKFMSFETAKKSIDFLIQHCRDSRLFGISFYGGEPLLAFDFMKKCVAYSKERAEGRDVAYNFTTNGTLITEEKFDFLVNNNFSIMISLDGPDSIHDKNRRFANGGHGSHKVIMKNLKHLRERHPDFYKNNITFNTVMDTSGTMSEINEFIKCNELIAEQKFQSTFVNDTYAKEELSLDNSFVTEFQYEMFKLLLFKTDWLEVEDIPSTMFGYFANTRRMFKSMKVSKQDKVPNSYHRGGPCYPAIQKLFVTVEGDLYPCERVSESSKVSKIGDIHSGIDTVKAKRILNLEQETSKECRNCWAYYYCTICISRAENNDEISSDKILSSCSDVKREVENRLQDCSILKEFGYDYEIDN